MNFYSCIFVLLFFSMNAQSQLQGDQLKMYKGTTILAFIKPDTAWIAADSKVTQKNIYTKKVDSSYNTRKIYKTGNIAYAFHGLPSIDYKNQRVFDATKTMAKSIKKGKDINTAYALFNTAILKELDSLITLFQSANAHNLLDSFTKEPFFGFLMLSYQNGKAEYFARKYRFKKTSKGIIAALEPDEYGHQESCFLMLGKEENVFTYLLANPSYFEGFKQMKEKLVCLIDKEVKANPNDVGFPVDVLILSHKRYRWFYNINECSLK